jgi:anaerobic magnesium-protoporphyrin IX monomethyl ester cyclase
LKIIFVQSYLGRKEPAIMPIGLSYLATMVPEHDLKLIDLNICENPYEELAKTLKTFVPDIVCISLRNIDSQQRKELFYYYKEFPKALKVIRTILPDVAIIAGGAGFSMFPRKIMERHEEIDFGVYLEGEDVFPALINNLSAPHDIHNIFYRRNGKVFFSKPGGLPDFRSLPIPRKDILNMERYKKDQGAIGVQTKRGCPFKCAYCNYPLLNGLKIRMRNPSQIVDEIEDLVRKYGINNFMFADGVFSSPIGHVKEICDEIKGRNINANWAAWCDVKDISEDFLYNVTSAGCNYIVISPDALSNEALDGLNKGFTEADVKKAYGLLKKWPKLRFGFGFFINPPGETFRGFLKMLSFYTMAMIELKLKGKGGGGLNWIRIEPDTRIYEIALKEKVITEFVDLLPENEDDLKNLFYTNPDLRFLDPIASCYVNLLKIRRIIAPKRIPIS